MSQGSVPGVTGFLSQGEVLPGILQLQWASLLLVSVPAFSFLKHPGSPLGDDICVSL